ncbi:uncharacterized protein [Haliotis asinina]|uniref:uncharacterized protein n=1 Tax=Haliotis asinina TaxID=109174 RepID=UPI00353246ED
MELTEPVLYIVLVTLHILIVTCTRNGTEDISSVSHPSNIVTMVPGVSRHKQQLTDLAVKNSSSDSAPPFRFPLKPGSKGLTSLTSARKKKPEYGNVPTQSLVVGLIFGALSVIGIIIAILVIKFRICKGARVAAAAEARPCSGGEEQ